MTEVQVPGDLRMSVRTCLPAESKPSSAMAWASCMVATLFAQRPSSQRSLPHESPEGISARSGLL